MLLNDSATIAVEVLFYLTPEDFTYFQSRGFTFPFGEHPILGAPASPSKHSDARGSMRTIISNVFPSPASSRGNT
jgi:hypothetical protein